MVVILLTISAAEFGFEEGTVRWGQLFVDVLSRDNPAILFISCLFCSFVVLLFMNDEVLRNTKQCKT